MGFVGNETIDNLRNSVARQATELIFCCSYFNLLGRFLESTRVDHEGEAVL